MEPRNRIAVLGHKLVRALELTGGEVSPPCLHATLLPTMNKKLSLEECADRAIRRAENVRFAPFRVTFDLTRSVAAGDRYPFVLCSGDGIEAFESLRRLLRRALRKEGLVVEGVSPPHVTLIWANHRVEEEYPVAPISWVVREFVLILSPIGEKRHIHLVRFPLLG